MAEIRHEATILHVFQTQCIVGTQYVPFMPVESGSYLLSS